MKGSGLILNQEITLSLRTRFRSQKAQREDDGAIQIQFPPIPYWSDDRWKKGDISTAQRIDTWRSEFKQETLKRSCILQRIAHKELGIISRTKCSWNLQKAGILFSVQRLHCPGES